jgi:hypothetical protein
MSASGRKVVILHAGTHKTATSYIQARIIQNRANLMAAGVYTRGKKDRTIQKNLLDADFWANTFSPQIVNDYHTILLSAEQFSKRLCCPKFLNSLIEITRGYNYDLRVVLFLRDQPDYLNAMFCHSTRRFYFNTPFDDYIQQHCVYNRRALNPDKDNTQNRADYFHTFAQIISNSMCDLVFVPFSVDHTQDPFDKLLAAVGVSGNWEAPTVSKINTQIGTRGIWFAQALMTKYGLRGFSLRTKMKRKKILRLVDLTAKLAKIHQWHATRYFGFTQDMYNRIRAHYATQNDLLAKKFWGCGWADVFPGKQNIVPQIYCPDFAQSQLELELLLQSVAASIKF